MNLFSRTLLSVFFGVFLTFFSHASLLTPEGTGPSVEKIQFPASVGLNLEGDALKLQSVGVGLRTKKVVFVNVKVYAAQLLVTAPDSFKKSEVEALASLKTQKSVAIQMHFLRSVDAEKVQTSFSEALRANSVNTEEASIKDFLKAVSSAGEAKEGKLLTVVGSKLKDGSEEISYESTTGQISKIKGNAGFIEKIFSIWLGKSSDDGIAQLKKSFLK